VSDDSHIPSDALPGDAAINSGDPVRVAIVSRSRDVADALWSALDKRSRGRNRPSRVPAERSDADVIVYLPDEEDFSTDEAAGHFEVQLARDAAPSKVVLEPSRAMDPLARARLEASQNRMRAQSDTIVWIAARSPDAIVDDKAENVLQLRAKRIERFLKSKARPAADRAARQKPERTRKARRARDPDARREARAKRIEQRDPSGDEGGKRRLRKTGERSHKGRVAAEQAAPKGRAPHGGDAAPSSRRQAKPQKTEAPGSPPLPTISIAIGGVDEASKVQLMASLKNAFQGLGARAVEAKPQSKAHIAIRSFDDDPFDVGEIGSRAQSLLEDKAYVRMFLGRTPNRGPENVGADDQAIAKISLLCRGAFLDLESEHRRHHAESLLEAKSDMSDFDLKAALIVREAINRKIRNLPLVPKLPAPAPDLADAYSLAARPSDLLSTLTWSAPNPPKLLQATFSAAEVEDFANSMSAAAGQVASGQIDWHAPQEGRAASRLLGLGFLVGPLTYWYCKASERKGGEIASTDLALKARGVTASALLERAGQIIFDFMDKMPLQPGSQGWDQDAVSSRIRVSLLYVLCCRLAAKRRIKFDEANCGAVFRGLVDHIEFLRSGLSYELASMEGVERDCLLATAGLALQQTRYGNVLLRDSLARLKKLQLDIGLSADGVWRHAPFATHCAVLSLLIALLGDLYAANSDFIDPIAEAARRMTLFVDALLKSNGEALPIDAAKGKSFASTLSGARRMLALVGARPVKGKPPRGMAANRITETYVFRDAQYFVSHSTPKVTAESSQVAFHADQGSPAHSDPGGLKLAFAHGPTDLLLGAVPRRKELSGDKAAAFDPALRNGYRILSGMVGDPGRAKAAIVKSWRGPGWAAAKGLEGGQGHVRIARIVVHLKLHHAMLVVDEISSISGETATLEQFWHIAPKLSRAPDMPLHFSAGDDVHLGVVLDYRHEAAVSIDLDGFSGCIRRTVRLATGVVATLFQRMDAAMPLSISLLRGEPDDWIAVLTGAGLAARVSLSSSELRVDEEPSQPPAV
jgi:hypothetical protein